MRIYEVPTHDLTQTVSFPVLLIKVLGIKMIANFSGNLDQLCG